MPQFGGWDQNEPGATDYSYTVVFTQARENKKHQKTNLTEIKHNQENSVHAHHGHANHHHARSHGHGHGHANGYPIVMVRPFSLIPISIYVHHQLLHNWR